MATADAVIPTYNDHDVLDRAVKSVLALPSVDRVHIVDDGSTPEASCPDDPRVCLHRIENSGPSVARNTGIEAALTSGAADYVVFCDADDELTPEIADALADAERTGAAVTLCSRIDIAADGSERRRSPPPEWAGRVLPNPSDVWRPIWLFGTPGAVVAKRVLEAGVRFDPKIRHGQDREFFRRCADHGEIFVSEAVGVRYRLGDGGNVSGWKHLDNRTRDFLYMMDMHLDDAGRGHWRESAEWLLNQLAKHGRDRGRWQELVAAATREGWRVPARARARRLVRDLLGRTS